MRIEDMVDMFDELEGAQQLEFFALLLEKMENGEVRLDNKPVFPQDIFIEDGYAVCAIIQDKISDM
jgi:hypothetical protein